MKKKFLIVESANDEAFFKALIKYLQQTDKIEVENTDVEQIDFEKRSANEEQEAEGLKESLKSIFLKVAKGGYDKIGIIWDMDDFYIEKAYPQTEDRVKYRISQMNTAIKNAIKELPLYTIVFANDITNINQFKDLTIQGVEINIGCYFVHHKGKGELENLLQAIKSKPSPLADCVNEKLPDCLKLQAEKPLKEKDLVKLWVNNYVRYDTLPDNNFPQPSKQRTEALTKWENVMAKRPYIFDFSEEKEKEVVELKELKNFLLELVK
jgi:hypothetical protein